MESPRDRRARAQSRILRALEQLAGKKLDWETLPDDLGAKLESIVEDFSQKPERRMRSTMSTVAENLRLRWSADSPSGHPYDARLDGQLYAGRNRLAVVELEARTPKQVRGALLDLITYPVVRKVLVIGVSEAVLDPDAMKKHITEQVLPTLCQKLSFNEEIGIFTEAELRKAPQELSKFLGLTSGEGNASGAKETT